MRETLLSKILNARYLVTTKVTSIWLYCSKEIQLQETPFELIIVQSSDGKSWIILKFRTNLRIAKLKEGQAKYAVNHTYKHKPINFIYQVSAQMNKKKPKSQPR